MRRQRRRRQGDRVVAIGRFMGRARRSGLLFDTPCIHVWDLSQGRVARWRQKSSAFGRELDSLADVISFGVAPAVIAYGCGMQGLYDRIVLVYFVACGVSGLGRFNVTPQAALDGGDQGEKF